MGALKKGPVGQSRVFKGMSWMALASLANVLMQLIVLALSARFMTPRDYGIVAAAMVVFSVALVVVQCGVPQALVQRPALGDEHVVAGFRIGWVGGLFGAVLVYCFAEAFGLFFDLPELTRVLQVLSWGLVFKGGAAAAEGMTLRAMDFHWIASRNTLAYFLAYVCLGLPLAVAGLGYWALVWALLANELLRSAMLLVGTRPRVRGSSLMHVRQLLRYGGGELLSSLLNRSAGYMDNLIVGKVLGASALGLYSRAFTLMAIPGNLFGDIVAKVLFPVMARAESNTELAGGFLRAASLVAFLAAPFCGFVAYHAADIVLLALGEQWMAVAPLFAILSLGLYFRLNYKLAAEALKARGRVYGYAFSQGLFALLILCGTLVGARFGLPGVAWGVNVAFLLNAAFLLLAVLRFLGLPLHTFALAQAPGVAALLLWLLLARLWEMLGHPLTGPWGLLPAGIVWVVAVLFTAAFAHWIPGGHHVHRLYEEVLERIKRVCRRSE